MDRCLWSARTEEIEITKLNNTRAMDDRILNKKLIILGILAEQCGLLPSKYDELNKHIDELADMCEGQKGEENTEALHKHDVSVELPHPDCDEVCSFYCTEGGTKPHKCKEGN